MKVGAFTPHGRLRNMGRPARIKDSDLYSCSTISHHCASCSGYLFELSNPRVISRALRSADIFEKDALLVLLQSIVVSLNFFEPASWRKILFRITTFQDENRLIKALFTSGVSLSSCN